MTKQELTDRINEVLTSLYPVTKCGLEHDGDVFKLLIMGILSAQCSDKAVNKIAPALFERFPDAESIAVSREGELEEYIHTLGLFNSKAKNIRACCKTIVDDFGGKIPTEMNDLLKLGGVGRKVANLVRGDAFNLGGIVTDTHFIRITNRLGLVATTNPYSVEKTMTPLVPTEEQSKFCHRFVLFGRDICTARNPKCSECPMRENNLCKGEL